MAHRLTAAAGWLARWLFEMQVGGLTPDLLTELLIGYVVR